MNIDTIEQYLSGYADSPRRQSEMALIREIRRLQTGVSALADRTDDPAARDELLRLLEPTSGLAPTAGNSAVADAIDQLLTGADKMLLLNEVTNQIEVADVLDGAAGVPIGRAQQPGRDW